MGVSITKEGLINAGGFSEIPYNPYDPTIYTEPDGSAWIRIVHHNNPAGELFSSTDNFNDFVYKDTNRWFFASLCDRNINDKWEFMVKQKYSSISSEEKYRWVQFVNPFIATWNDVKAANVEKNTTSGYNVNTSSGGIYKHNTNTYFVIANASSGNWYGALGCWTAYQGGIPGFPNTTVTSGYMDLYYRIGNTASIFKNTVQVNEFIEW